MGGVPAEFPSHPPGFRQHPQCVLDPQHCLRLSEQASTPVFGAFTASPGAGCGGSIFPLSLGRPARWSPGDRVTGPFYWLSTVESLDVLGPPDANAGAVWCLQMQSDGCSSILCGKDVPSHFTGITEALPLIGALILKPASGLTNVTAHMLHSKGCQGPCQRFNALVSARSEAHGCYCLL